MTTGEIKLSEEVLRWIRTETRGRNLPQEAVDTLAAWECGAQTPTFREIEKMSAVTGIPLGYFFLSSPPEEDSLLAELHPEGFSGLTHPSCEFLDTVHSMSMVQDWMRTRLIEEGMDRCWFVGPLRGVTDVLEAASVVRNLLGLETDWLRNRTAGEALEFLRSRMMENGAVVMMASAAENDARRPLDPGEVRAFALRDDFAPLIFLNSNDTVEGMVFSILHAFATLCVGKSGVLSGNNPVGEPDNREDFCGAVTMELLLPDGRFRTAWAEEVSQVGKEAAVQARAEGFGRGTERIIRSALDYQTMDKDTYDRIVGKTAGPEDLLEGKSGAGGDRTREPLSRMDPRFLRTLKDSVEAGKTTYTEAFQLTNTDWGTFERLMKTLQEHDG